MNKLLRMLVSFGLAVAITAGLLCLVMLPLWLATEFSDTYALVFIVIMFLVVLIGVAHTIYKEIWHD